MDNIEIHAEVSRLLESACEPGSDNLFTVFEVRDHALTFLNDYDSEIARFSELAGTTHFEFIMADGDSSREAAFVAYLFREQVLELIAGRGDSVALRRLVEREISDEPDVAIESLRLRARHFAGSVQIERQSAVRWLGRDWR